MNRARHTYSPREAAVRADQSGAPRWLGAVAVDAIREDWLVDLYWWTGRRLRRRYYELVLVNGRCVTVFRDLRGGRWYRQ